MSEGNRKIQIGNKTIDLARFTSEISRKNISAKFQPLFDFFDGDRSGKFDILENFLFSTYILEKFANKDSNSKELSDIDIKALQEELPVFKEFSSAEIKEFILQMYSAAGSAHDIENTRFIVDYLSNYAKNNSELLDNINYGGFFDKIGAFFTELGNLDFNTFENLNDNLVSALGLSSNLKAIQGKLEMSSEKKAVDTQYVPKFSIDNSIPPDNTRVAKKEFLSPKVLKEWNLEYTEEFNTVTEEKFVAIKDYLEKKSGKKIEPYQFTEFMQKTGRYNYLRGLKQKTKQLNKGLEEVKRLYEQEKVAQYNRSPYADNTPKKTWRDVFGETVNQYFEGDETLKQLVIEAMGADFNANSDYKDLRNILNNLKKMSNELYTQALNGENFSDIENDYKSSFKNLYGIDEVSNEVMENVTSSLENSGMFKIGLLIAINLILSKATAGATTPYMNALIAKYGVPTVNIAVKIMSSLMTTSISYGLDVLNEATSANGITSEDWDKINNQALHTAGIVLFSSFVSAPVAQKITNSIKMNGIVERAFVNGNSKVTNGITTTSMSGSNFLKAIENYYKSASGVTQNVVANTVGLAAEIPMFAMYDTIVSELSYDESLKGSAEALTKIKIMSYLLNALLGRSINHLSSSLINKNNQMNAWEVRLQKKYLEDLKVSEIKTPDGKITYNVSLGGKSLFSTKNPNELTICLVSTIAQTLSKQEVDYILGQYNKLQNQVNEAKKLLGISENETLTEEVIQKAWKAKVKLTHPDKATGNHDNTTAVNAVRDLLKNFVAKDPMAKMSAQGSVKALPSKTDPYSAEANTKPEAEAAKFKETRNLQSKFTSMEIEVDNLYNDNIRSVYCDKKFPLYTVKGIDVEFSEQSGAKRLKRSKLPKTEPVILVSQVGTNAGTSTLDKTLFTYEMIECAALAVVDRTNNRQTLIHVNPGLSIEANKAIIKHILSKSNPKEVEISVVHGDSESTFGTIQFILDTIEEIVPTNKVNLYNFDQLGKHGGVILKNGELTCCDVNKSILDDCKNIQINPKDNITRAIKKSAKIEPETIETDVSKKEFVKEQNLSPKTDPISTPNKTTPTNFTSENILNEMSLIKILNNENLINIFTNINFEQLKNQILKTFNKNVGLLPKEIREYIKTSYNFNYSEGDLKNLIDKFVEKEVAKRRKYKDVNNKEIESIRKQIIEKIENVENSIQNEMASFINNKEIQSFLNAFTKIPGFSDMINKNFPGIHRYTLDIHTLKVIQNVLRFYKTSEYKLNDTEKVVLFYASLLHDIGKPMLDNSSQDIHPLKSRDVAEQIMKSLHIDSNIIERVCMLIEYHEWYGDLSKGKIKISEIRKFNDRHFKLLKILTLSDIKAISDLRLMSQDPSALWYYGLSQFNIMESYNLPKINLKLKNYIINNDADNYNIFLTETNDKQLRLCNMDSATDSDILFLWAKRFYNSFGEDEYMSRLDNLCSHPISQKTGEIFIRTISVDFKSQEGQPFSIGKPSNETTGKYYPAAIARVSISNEGLLPNTVIDRIISDKRHYILSEYMPLYARDGNLTPEIIKQHPLPKSTVFIIENINKAKGFDFGELGPIEKLPNNFGSEPFKNATNLKGESTEVVVSGDSKFKLSETNSPEEFEFNIYGIPFKVKIMYITSVE